MQIVGSIIASDNRKRHRLQWAALTLMSGLLILMQSSSSTGQVAMTSDPVVGDSVVGDSWRRTAKGWERTESWVSLVRRPIGKLKPLSVDTLLQRTWPGVCAVAELCLVLAILNAGRAKDIVADQQLRLS